jgi:hypothetical protein
MGDLCIGSRVLVDMRAARKLGCAKGNLRVPYGHLISWVLRMLIDWAFFYRNPQVFRYSVNLSSPLRGSDFVVPLTPFSLPPFGGLVSFTPVSITALRGSGFVN